MKKIHEGVYRGGNSSILSREVSRMPLSSWRITIVEGRSPGVDPWAASASNPEASLDKYSRLWELGGLGPSGIVDWEGTLLNGSMVLSKDIS